MIFNLGANLFFYESVKLLANNLDKYYNVFTLEVHLWLNLVRLL